MILSLEQSADDLWLNIKQHDARIKSLASLSLIESQHEKEQFQADCYQALENLTWDSLSGGFYQLEQNKAILNLEKNAIIAQFLLGLGQAFFDGQFTYLGNQALTAISRLLCNDKAVSSFGELHFHLSRMACYLKGKKLKHVLSTQQCQLLAALLGVESFEDEKSYFIHYRFALRQAADIANIHFKQAQVVEQELRELLLSFENPRESLISQTSQASIGALAQLLSTFTQTIIWHKQENHVSLARYVSELLFNKLSLEAKNCNSDEMIVTCYALLDYAQVNYERENLDCLATCFAQQIEIPASEISYRVKTLLFQSIYIFKQLGYFKNYSVDYSLFAIEEDMLPRVVLLEKSRLESEPLRQKLLSCFDPTLKIYSTT